MNDYLQISFLPWAGLRTSLDLGPIIFWPYNVEASQRIADIEIREHLDKYFQSYVDHQGNPVDTITICSYKEKDFNVLDETESEDLRNAVDVLIFSTIAPQIKRAVCADNYSFGPPSADVFELVTQNFPPGDDLIHVKIGSLTSGGWKIGEITFPKPWATGGSFGTPEEKITEGFSKCFSSQISADIRDRLFRSLEWFRMAHIEGGQVSPLSKVVMMATLFEILLEFPRNYKRSYFAEYMEKNVASAEFFKDKRQTSKGKIKNLSLAGCWAWDFYELRNQIVHGDPVAPEGLIYKSWITHLIVADLVFLECLTRQLFEHKCIGDNVYSLAEKWDKEFPQEPKGSSLEHLVRLTFGFNNVHRALGWISEEKPRGEARWVKRPRKDD